VAIIECSQTLKTKIISKTISVTFQK